MYWQSLPGRKKTEDDSTHIPHLDSRSHRSHRNRTGCSRRAHWPPKMVRLLVGIHWHDGSWGSLWIKHLSFHGCPGCPWHHHGRGPHWSSSRKEWSWPRFLHSFFGFCLWLVPLWLGVKRNVELCRNPHFTKHSYTEDCGTLPAFPILSEMQRHPTV